MFEFMTSMVRRVFGDANDREIRRLQPLVARINDLEPRWKELSDAELTGKTAEFRQRLEQGQPLDELIPEAFATVRETSWRVMGMRHYDCQLVGGLVIHQGKIAEMKTGEGKTLVGTTPVYLNALVGKGVHVVTVNDYLAERDANWMRPIYERLGMSVGIILSGDRAAGSTERKRAAYAADITYGTNNEFGFDYLRDNMKFRLEDYVQRGHHFAIVDEVDSILVDEARTPLIISGPAQGDVELYNVVDAVIPLLQKDIDFVLDEKSKNVSLTEEGIARVEDRLGIDNLYDPQNIDVLHHAMQSLKAHHLFKRDRDYVVKGAEVIIVDEFTGRLMHGRRWSDGLHQAVEAKEKVKVQDENQTYATITYQNLYRMYGKLAGMTGTAVTESAEFMSIYKLPVVVIPTHRPVARLDHQDVVYATQMGKFQAVVQEIKEAHGRGQPVLVGTTSVEKSQLVANMLGQMGVPHEVLNAKNHAREAHIVAQAGRLGSVTISTNMAGRGTDIRLGGNAEELVVSELADREGDAQADPEGYQHLVAAWRARLAAGEQEEAWRERLAYWREICTAEAEKVKAAGGLYIIGTERHESRRVDNQLRGRAGRQGDPGASKFYLALDDHLMKIFASDRVTNVMKMMGLRDDEAIEHGWVTASIESAQKKVEAYNFGVRKNVLEYDDVMNYQRKGVYDLRLRALQGEGTREMIEEAVKSVVGDIMDDFCSEGLNAETWNLKAVRENLDRVFGLVWSETDDALRDMPRLELEQRMLQEAQAVIAKRREELGEVFDTVARQMLLRLTDDLWRDHLLAIDRLRQGVGLRGYGQRNPILEYKRDAFKMFMMMSAVRDERWLQTLMRVQLQPAAPQPSAPAPIAAPEAARPSGLGARSFVPQLDGVDTLPDDAGDVLAIPEASPGFSLTPPPSAPAVVARPAKGDEARAFAAAHGLRRNDPCPCGSGQKFKKCCGGDEDPAASPA
jgi:preprotein translocase subunit SecA